MNEPMFDMRNRNGQAPQGAPEPEKKGGPMKRVLAWVVMALIEFVIMNLVGLAVRLVMRGVFAIMDLSRALFWIIVFLGGAGVIASLIWGLIALSGVAVSASERICPSKRGGRYTAFGAIMIALYGLSLVLQIVNRSGITGILETVGMLGSLVMFLFIAKAHVESR